MAAVLPGVDFKPVLNFRHRSHQIRRVSREKFYKIVKQPKMWEKEKGERYR